MVSWDAIMKGEGRGYPMSESWKLKVKALRCIMHSRPRMFGAML